MERAVAGVSVIQTNLAAALSTSGTVSLAGGASAVSGASAALAVTSSQSETAMTSELDWLDEALFFGATASAFQLGTVLSGGWFWMRQAECVAIYRGPSPARVDFDNVLAVTKRGSQQIVLPDFLTHDPNARYCYVARSFNVCGYSEQTMSAAAIVCFDAEGRLVPPAPNGVFGLRAELLSGSKIQLVWSYCPIDQQAEPDIFQVYTDGGAGQVDFETPLASLPYAGCRFYRCITDSLSEGVYRFAVAAVSRGRVVQGAPSFVCCPVGRCCPESVTILAAEVMSR
jgi:hypothetical protein